MSASPSSALSSSPHPPLRPWRDHPISQLIARRLGARLSLLQTPAPVGSLVGHLGSAASVGLPLLRQQFPKATILQIVDVAPTTTHLSIGQRLRLLRHHRRWQSHAARLPLRDDSLAGLWSHLQLPLHEPGTKLNDVLREAQRVLTPGRPFIFSALGPDSFIELREAWAAAGASDRLMVFPDMHDLGDALVAHGFVDPVMEMEQLLLTFKDVAALFKALRANTPPNRAPRLTAKQWQALQGWQGWHEGGARLTLEVLYGHAWKTTALPRATAEPSIISWQPRRG